MTYSILACEPESGRLGSAVASRSVAVGGTVTYSRFDVGVVNTQHYAHLAAGQRVLDAMEDGLHPQEALDRVLAEVERADRLQLTAIDVDDRKGAWTGSACTPVREQLITDTCVAAGNMLASAEVVPRMAEAFEGASERSLGERLLAALEAGQAAGGDFRGRQSAAVRVVPPRGSAAEVNLDLRVDDHRDPLAELRRLHAAFRREFGADPAGR